MRYFKQQMWVMLVLGLAVSAGSATAACKSSQIRGLYGLATQALGAAGIEGTTLSLFDFDGTDQVSEVYFVNTHGQSWKSSAKGRYSVVNDCSFHLEVKDLSGVDYALEGQINAKTGQVNVLQTLPEGTSVSAGILRPVGLRRCRTRDYFGRYAFLSQGRVPSPVVPALHVPESRVGWFFAGESALEQPVQWVNTNGVLVETPPETIPSETLESCLVDLADGGFAGVLVDRGRLVYYMDLEAGSYRLGLMQKVR